MGRSIPLVFVTALATAALAGCGSGDRTVTAPPRAHLALLDAPKHGGEIVVRGESTPGEHGPYALSGRYRVRFEQVAPEDPKLDFTTQTAFVATLRPPAGPGRAIRLFRAAARTGDRTLTIDGRWLLEIEFGDFPYALRLTPA